MSVPLKEEAAGRPVPVTVEGAVQAEFDDGLVPPLLVAFPGAVTLLFLRGRQRA
ncbi:hypothetical protein [Streptomyces fuscichromogenes]|uniref:Uncharacterized protein n=1 Tax=Streptomyces fuscichromogenes TaxID=1324013 RepID=A0A917XID8_9ACTN|nr:hypothetical protein [Streptomyces fuscichromogenes]GGN28884.1 hypothetical protein GCM10011578_065200 [Streptomyces fuscichromogenes]